MSAEERYQLANGKLFHFVPSEILDEYESGTGGGKV